MKDIISLFGGGGGADVGAQQAGYRHTLSIEYDAKIAGVADMNGFTTMVSDVCAVDFTTLTTPAWLHMSPPCVRASQANAKAGESPLDQALADACIRAITAMRPRRISLENVWGYRTFAAFRSILAALAAEGYAVDYWHLNAADYGVPQTRKRLMLVASLDHTPIRPEPTHYDASAGHTHMLYQRWRGWYAAIEDLIPPLPDIEPKKWQRPGQAHRESILVSPKEQRSNTYRVATQPAMTMVIYARPSHLPWAFIANRGRVAKMTPRCLARFNGLPDSYKLPDNNMLACKVLGNMHMPAIQRAVMLAND